VTSRVLRQPVGFVQVEADLRLGVDLVDILPAWAAAPCKVQAHMIWRMQAVKLPGETTLGQLAKRMPPSGR